VSCSGLTFRRPIPDDYERVMAVLPSWWDGRDLRAQLPWVFFTHFRTTSIVVEHEDVLVGFLVGVLCPDHGDEAYVHFVGVAPEWRRTGLAGDLYRRFFALARRHGRTVVRAVTAPVNTDSLAFHAALGFSILPGDAEVDGVPVMAVNGPSGEPRVQLERSLGPAAVT
jgi:ribosomal protein S18 acetylase RimI-like enzyme